MTVIERSSVRTRDFKILSMLVLATQNPSTWHLNRNAPDRYKRALYCSAIQHGKCYGLSEQELDDYFEMMPTLLEVLIRQIRIAQA
jgi:hypothetical protein